MLALSPQISLSPSSTLKMNEEVNVLWAAGETVYHFGFGESRFPAHPKLLAALTAHGGRTSYLPVQGLPELRSAVAAYYGPRLKRSFRAEDVIITPGSKAILFALQMALDAELLLPTPSWVSYGPQAALLGRRQHRIQASAADGYRLTLDALDQTVQKAGAGQKLLVLNTPNNPSGRMLSEELLIDLANYCRRNNIFVISDEIYGLVPHASTPHRSLVTYYPEGTAVLGGLSKHLSLGGWRLGHGILPSGEPELMRAVVKIASEIWSCPAAPIQYAALTAYANDPEIEAYIADCAAIHTHRTRYLWGWFEEMGIDCPEPEGGFYLFPNFDRWRESLAAKGVATSAELSNYLLTHYKIATLPAADFGVPPHELSLRVATSYIDMEDDVKAADMLGRWRANRDPDLLLAGHTELGAAIDALKRFILSLT